MQSFISRKNVENFRRLLQLTADEAERRVLLQLLKDEEEKLSPTKSKHDKPPS
jgi:hypothetical protein